LHFLRINILSKIFVLNVSNVALEAYSEDAMETETVKRCLGTLPKITLIYDR
jgi:hypothetical protein